MLKITRHRLQLIEKPKEGSASVITKGNSGNKQPYFSGKEETNYLCGNPECDQIILRRVNKNQLQSIVYECPSCHSYNI